MTKLSGATWLQQPELQTIFAALDGGTRRTRAVGGIVRDTVLDRLRPDTDIDLATESLPQEVMARAQAAGIAAYPTGIDHGTVTLRLGDLSAEVTTLRQDVETDGRHAVVKFGADWHRDAERRDFTLNALYANMDGTIFDPLGGLADCLASRVRFIGDADRRIAEDRLRVYRFFRFSASHSGQLLDAEGLAAATRASGDLGALSAERVGAEMVRMLALPKVSATLTAMSVAGVLDFSQGLLAQLQTYEAVAGRPGLNGRLALVAVDIGVAALQNRWRLSTEQVRVLEPSLNAANLIVRGAIGEAVYRYRAVVSDAIDLAASLAEWPAERAKATRDQALQFSPPTFPVSGSDMILSGWAPGKALGQELARLERLWIDGGFQLSRDDLLSLVPTRGSKA